MKWRGVIEAIFINCENNTSLGYIHSHFRKFANPTSGNVTSHVTAPYPKHKKYACKHNKNVAMRVHILVDFFKSLPTLTPSQIFHWIQHRKIFYGIQHVTDWKMTIEWRHEGHGFACGMNHVFERLFSLFKEKWRRDRLIPMWSRGGHQVTTHVRLGLPINVGLTLEI